MEACIQFPCSPFLQDSDRHHTGMSYAHSQNAASIGREYKLLLERNAARRQRQRHRSSALLFMVLVPASVGVSVLSSYLWISLLVGVENLFGCSRVSCRTLYPIGALHCLKTLFFASGPVFHFPSYFSLDSRFISLLWLLFSFMVQLLHSRKPMPSFALVLTSGCHSLPPSIMQFDSYTAPKMLPAAPDYLMVIHLTAFCVFLADFTSFRDRVPWIYVTVRRMH